MFTPIWVQIKRPFAPSVNFSFVVLSFCQFFLLLESIMHSECIKRYIFSANLFERFCFYFHNLSVLLSELATHTVWACSVLLLWFCPGEFTILPGRIYNFPRENLQRIFSTKKVLSLHTESIKRQGWSLIKLKLIIVF